MFDLSSLSLHRNNTVYYIGGSFLFGDRSFLFKIDLDTKQSTLIENFSGRAG